jgi:methionyl-tRNA formyltransferase
LEKKVPRTTFLKRRVRKLGLWRVIGQLLFTALVNLPLSFLAKKRIAKIKEIYNLSDQMPAKDIITHVNSVNSGELLEILSQKQPGVILVSGTRIISERILDAANVPFVNIHVGINPAYRGVHGGYWAFTEGNPHLAGVTVHLIDKGIDTGGVLGQDIIHITPQDNFCTYPLLQLAAGLAILKSVLDQFDKTGELPLKPSLAEKSKLWSHPTFGQYFRNRLKGVK